MSKSAAHLDASVQLSYKESFERNFHLSFQPDDSSIHGLSIKSDETYINPALRYCPKTNQIVGVCKEHHGNVNLDFNSMEDAYLLQKKLKDDEVHIPKECLVTGLSSLVKNIPFEVLVMWPTCSKNNFEGTIIKTLDFIYQYNFHCQTRPFSINFIKVFLYSKNYVMVQVFRS